MTGIASSYRSMYVHRYNHRENKEERKSGKIIGEIRIGLIAPLSRWIFVPPLFKIGKICIPHSKFYNESMNLKFLKYFLYKNIDPLKFNRKGVIFIKILYRRLYWKLAVCYYVPV